ncbi:hypothetical protein CBS115989_5267 [Aspergillus niger]|nr:hypothetical protein CBS115989_5267 [Aspergillus niger]
MASAGLICQGEAGRRYRLVRPLGTVRGKSCNVWLGLDDSKPDAEYIMKRPLADQNEESWSGALSAFKHELEMQRLFAKDPMIRKLVDYLAQLLQAQVDFKSPGMYDSIQTGTLAEKGNVIRDQLAIDFDLSSVPFYAEDEQCAKFLPTPQPEEAYMWANTMIEKGVSGEDIQFLVEVLNPDPNARLTVREILESGYLEV